MGGHRGFALAVTWELLSGVLSGGDVLADLGLPAEAERPVGSCLFLLAVDPGGIPFSAADVKTLTALGDRLGLPWPG